MSDLINGRTPEEIKRGIKCHVSWGDCSTECPYDDVRNKPAHECIQSMTKDALALIEHLEAKQPKWISVKERLPEVYGTYLTFTQCPKGNWIETNIYEHHEERWEHDCGYHTEDVTDWITHWMPLPEPPKEETHETTY